MSVRGESLASSPGSARARRLDAHRFRGACVAAVTALTLFVSLGVSTGVTAFADDADVVTPAQTQPAEDEQSTADAKKDDAPADDPVIEEQTAETPRLVWEARDEDDKFVDGVTFELQGPGDGVATDDDQWKNATKAAVEDNTGQSGYVGLDGDPAPGVFVVAQLDDDTAVEEATYRVIPTAPDTLLTGDDAEWTPVKATTSDDEDPAVVTVKPIPPAAEPAEEAAESLSQKSEQAPEETALAEGEEPESEATETPLPAEEPSAADRSAAEAAKGGLLKTAGDELNGDSSITGGVTAQPFALGPDGANPPYVYWETRDAVGNTLRGGATYELQGPRTSGSFLWWETDVSWDTSITVTDCVSALCAGPDLDPDPGEFLVKQIGNHNISSSNRYRVRQVTPPANYTFVNTANPWVEIPGNRNTPSGWSGTATYDFGDFQVRVIPSSSPRCEAGYVYGVSSGGQLRQVAPRACLLMREARG